MLTHEHNKNVEAFEVQASLNWTDRVQIQDRKLQNCKFANIYYTRRASCLSAGAAAAAAKKMKLKIKLKEAVIVMVK